MRNYKFFRITEIDPKVADDFYAQNPEYKEKSYQEQLEALYQIETEYGGSFQREMKKFGVEAYDILSNQETLQKTWAKEHGLTIHPDNWKYEIIMKQIETIRPDIVYIQKWEIEKLPKIIKETFPFVRSVLGFKGYPSGLEFVEGVDLLFSCHGPLTEYFSKNGVPTDILYHCFDDGILQKLKSSQDQNDTPSYDFTFVGSTKFTYQYGYHFRYWYLYELMKKTNLECWITEYLHLKNMDGKKKLKLLLRNLFERLLWRLRADELKAIADRKFLPKNIRLAFLEMVLKKEPVEGRRQLEYTNIPRIPRKMLSEIHPSRCHFSVFGMEMYKKLSESKITFNCHADQAIGEVGNMRMFDATGVGACLLTDTGGNIRDLFEPDKEIVTYTSIEECVEKVNYLLNHENERKQIAAAGQKRTLKDHTVFNRCQQINEVIQKILKEENKGHL